ncbi:MAG: rRNA maturation RNase YbeY [Ignavibacteriales bacterium]|nr:rRNA maturation RNase YbeY [Ignavibacteriales bacterium]
MIRISVFSPYKKHRIRVVGTEWIVSYVLKKEMVKNAEINIIFINDSSMIKLNQTYLRHNYPTDVISFNMSSSDKQLEGEIYINIDQARRQALENSVTYREEYARLVIHGTLHLIGYNDSTRKLRNEMTFLENKYLNETIYSKLKKF